MMKYSYMAIAMVAVLSALGSGCALTKDRINLHYTPQQGVAKLEGADQVALTVTVKDARTTEKDIVGSKKNGYGMEMGAIISKDDVATLVSKAIAEELRNRGFTVNGGSASVGIELTKFLNDFKVGFFSGTAAGEVAYTIQIKKPDGSINYAKAVVGSYNEEPIFLYAGHNAKTALEGALKDATTKLVQDEAFIQALLQAS